MKNKRLITLIVDDEKGQRDLLRYHLEKNIHVTCVDEAASAEEALFKIIDVSPDLIFLDIVMPGRTGVELVELLEKRWIFRDIVLMSHYKDSAIEAIKTGIYDFLLKPVKSCDLEKIIDKYRLRKNKKLDEKLGRVFNNLDDGKKIRLSSIKNDLLVEPDDIMYCRAQGSYTVLFFENGNKQWVSMYLGMLTKILSGHRFFRISRSLLINMDKLSKVNRGDNSCTLIATNKKEIKLFGTRKQVKFLCDTGGES